MTEVAVRFVGKPDGPTIFVKELDQEVPTFTAEPGGKFPALNYHVPLNKRGPYRIIELPYKCDFATDSHGYVLCQGITQAGDNCQKRANNRSLRCDQHGGRLHPLDKISKDTEPDGTNSQESQSLSRYRQFVAGQITVDDLDDEELATCGFRSSNGRIYKPRNVPREMATAFTKAVYERAQDGIKANVVDAVQIVAGIMKNPKVEYDIRLKAANTLLDRGLGKAPQTINHSVDLTGFEQVFDGIYSGSRESSRAGTVIDAEIVEPDPPTGDPIENVHLPVVIDEPISPESVVSEQDSRDKRMFERNPAILAQTVEIKPFEYDLSDHSDEIKKDTRKRYAQRALDVSDPVLYVREQLPNGMFRHVLPKQTKPTAPQRNSKVEARKKYTLSDFS